MASKPACISPVTKNPDTKHGQQLCFGCFSLKCCCDTISPKNKSTTSIFDKNNSVSDDSVYFCTDCCAQFTGTDIELHKGGKCLQKPKRKKTRFSKTNLSSSDVHEGSSAANPDMDIKFDVDFYNRNNLSCTQCHKVLTNLQHYNYHWNVAHQDVHKSEMFTNGIGCYFCKRYFPTLNSYRPHLRRVHAKDLSTLGVRKSVDNARICYICGYVDKDPDKIPYHLYHQHQISESINRNRKIARRRICRRRHGNDVIEGEFQCSMCRRVFKNVARNSYANHWDACHPNANRAKMYQYVRPVACKLCDSRFFGKTGYHLHLVKCHSGADAKILYCKIVPFKRAACSLCEFSCEDRRTLNRHVEHAHDADSQSMVAKLINDEEDDQVRRESDVRYRNTRRYVKGKNDRYKVKCTACAKIAGSITNYEKHWNSFHKNVDKSKMYKKSIGCRYCLCRFPMLLGYSFHLTCEHRSQMRSDNVTRNDVIKLICRACFFVANDSGALEKHLDEDHRGLSATDMLLEGLLLSNNLNSSSEQQSDQKICIIKNFGVEPKAEIMME